jgi:hypothetical protein
MLTCLGAIKEVHSVQPKTKKYYLNLVHIHTYQNILFHLCMEKSMVC